MTGLKDEIEDNRRRLPIKSFFGCNYFAHIISTDILVNSYCTLTDTTPGKPQNKLLNMTFQPAECHPCHMHYLQLFYYIDTSLLLENIPLVKFIKTTSGTRVVYFW